MNEENGSLEWGVGVDALDVHHRQVWRRIRHLANAVADGRTDEVRAALRFLHGYLAEHNAEEERWMAEAGYPSAREHARAHAEIVGRIKSAREAEARPPLAALFQAAASVGHALEAHMRHDDLKLARFWAARENLRRLAESGQGVSLTPIPGTLGTVGPAAARAPTPAGPAGAEIGPARPKGR